MIKRIRFNYRHLICIAIIGLLVACTYEYIIDGIFRLIEACRDLGFSVAYYFCELFDIDRGFEPTVGNYSNLLEIKEIFFPKQTIVSEVTDTPTVPIDTVTEIIPKDYDSFQNKWGLFWQLFISKNNLLGYLLLIGRYLVNVSRVLTIILPLIFVISFMVKRSLRKQNNKYNQDTKPLKVWKKIEKHIIRRCKDWIKGIVYFARQNRGYTFIATLILVIEFNFLSIVIEFLAFYLYFVFSFDLIHIYKQVYKLFVDLTPMFKIVPIPLWVILGVVWFDRFRKVIALDRLNHMELKNRGFINARPIVTMTCGSMGKKKTTMITDMALSQEAMLRDKAFEKILENDLKFPNFPWCNLENAIKRAIDKHLIFSLATCKVFIRILKKRFMVYERLDKASRKSYRRHYSKTQKWNTYNNLLFDYDYEEFGYFYDDKLKVVDVWEILEIYSQLYFIYVIQSSLMVSNYSIRTDAVLASVGNFPLWNTDFFNSDSRLMDSYSRHSHILDFDCLRLGRKVIENNENADALEFGAYVITEIGKERGNNLELQEKKKGEERANQKNDLFNYSLKMIRHSATVDNFPFVKVITDEQRPESWGADARDLSDIIHIVETKDTKLAMPFFALGELLHNYVFNKLFNPYVSYKYNRADNCLLMYIMKNILAIENNYYKRIYNRYGYFAMEVETETGTQDGKREKHLYYLSLAKIYKKRFATDCFSDYYVKKALRSKKGLDDMREYNTERATLRELEQQNSYFITDIKKYM